MPRNPFETIKVVRIPKNELLEMAGKLKEKVQDIRRLEVGARVEASEITQMLDMVEYLADKLLMGAILL